MDEILKDKRFSHVASDPRFRKLPRSERKVKIDQRFKAMFTDDKFKLKYAVDKRGRPVQQTQADNLKKYYELASGSEEEDDEEGSGGDEEGSGGDEEGSGGDEEGSGRDEEVSGSDEEVAIPHEVGYVSQGEDEEGGRVLKKAEPADSGQPQDDGAQSKLSQRDQLKERSKLIDSVHKGRMKDAIAERLKDVTVDYARGIGMLGSDDSSSDESSSEDSEDEVAHPWGELDKDAETTEEPTPRLAACNLDWDRITAKDLFVLFTSFLPTEGFVKSVVIYPSEFGLERIKAEELKGPKELFENPKFQEFDEQDFSDKHSEGNQYCMEKLREYQLNRLKYYYAVVTFDRAETANKIYTECDGIEYESSATKMDLRFIPDDMEFHQEPKESCDSMPDVTKYKPRLFVNSALQQGTVNLTWDETDPNRVEFTRKLASGGNINDDDIQAYVAASSDSEDQGESGNEDEREGEDATKTDQVNDPIARYKALLSSVTSDNQKRKNNVDMEVTWGVGLGDEDSGSEIGAKSDDDVSDGAEKKDALKNRKSKKVKKGKKLEDGDEDKNENAELQLLLADDAADESVKGHFNFKDIQKEEKRKKKKRKFQKAKEDDAQDGDKFEIDVNDSRFSALYTSHHFNIDPADPRFVRTEAADRIIQEKQKRRKFVGERDGALVGPKEQKMTAEMASLVKSIKGKRSGT